MVKWTMARAEKKGKKGANIKGPQQAQDVWADLLRMGK